MSKARCVLWLNPDQAPTLKRVLAHADIELIAAGSPDSGRTGQVASDLNCDPVDDIRVALTSIDADLLILAAPGSFADQANDADLDALKAAHARNLSVATFEPIPATSTGIGGTSYVDALSTGALDELVQMIPLTRHTPLIDELYTVLETFGPIRSCNITLGMPQLIGSLGARLFDAMDLIRSLVGVPGVVDASYISPSAGRGMHPLPGQSLRYLHGEFTLNLRFSDGRCGAVLLTNQVGASTIHLNMLSAEGHIIADHTGFKWFNPSGKMIDSYTTPDLGKTDANNLDPSEIAVANQLIELCSGVGPQRAPIDYQGVLSMAHATLLSTRTGQGESPRAVDQLLLSM